MCVCVCVCVCVCIYIHIYIYICIYIYTYICPYATAIYRAHRAVTHTCNRIHTHQVAESQGGAQVVDIAKIEWAKAATAIQLQQVALVRYLCFFVFVHVFKTGCVYDSTATVIQLQQCICVCMYACSVYGYVYVYTCLHLQDMHILSQQGNSHSAATIYLHVYVCMFSICLCYVYTCLYLQDMCILGQQGNSHSDSAAACTYMHTYAYA